MKKVVGVTVFLFLSLCLISTTYAGFLDDMKKAVENVAPSDEKDKQEQKETESQTKETTSETKPNETKNIVPTKSDVDAFGLSWDASEKEGVSYLKTKGYSGIELGSKNPPFLQPFGRIYQDVTGNKLEGFENLSKYKSKGVKLYEFKTLIASNTKSNNIRKVGYRWSTKFGLLYCTVEISKLNFGQEALKKYGEPVKTGSHSIRYVYPKQGDVGIVLMRAMFKSIYYINIPRMEAFFKDIKEQLSVLDAKEKAKQNKESKDF